MGFWKWRGDSKDGLEVKIEPPAPRMDLATRFLLDDLYISPCDGSLVGIAAERREVILGTVQAPVQVKYEDLLAAEVLKNGVTVTQANRGSQAVGAAIGGAVFGGVGALAGALSGSTRSKERLSGLALKITSRHLSSPVHKVTFLPEVRGKGVELTSKEGRRALSALERVHALLSAALVDSDRNAQRKDAPAKIDILERLLKLRQHGGLTEDEFLAEKARVLENNLNPTDQKSDRDADLTTHIAAWGPVIGIHLVQLFDECWPEMKLADSMSAAHRLQKARTGAIVSATPGEAARLRADLSRLGATVESAHPPT